MSPAKYWEMHDMVHKINCIEPQNVQVKMFTIFIKKSNLRLPMIWCCQTPEHRLTNWWHKIIILVYIIFMEIAQWLAVFKNADNNFIDQLGKTNINSKWPNVLWVPGLGCGWVITSTRKPPDVITYPCTNNYDRKEGHGNTCGKKWLSLLLVALKWENLWLKIVWCRYNAVNFLLNPHKRQHIAHPLGTGIGRLLWVQPVIKFCPSCVIMALDFTWISLSPGMI